MTLLCGAKSKSNRFRSPTLFMGRMINSCKTYFEKKNVCVRSDIYVWAKIQCKECTPCFLQNCRSGVRLQAAHEAQPIPCVDTRTALTQPARPLHCFTSDVVQHCHRQLQGILYTSSLSTSDWNIHAFEISWLIVVASSAYNKLFQMLKATNSRFRTFSSVIVSSRLLSLREWSHRSPCSTTTDASKAEPTTTQTR